MSTHGRGNSKTCSAMSEKATFQHLNDELEALVNCQEGSAWESSSELDELRKLLEEEKNTRKLKESK